MRKALAVALLAGSLPSHAGEKLDGVAMSITLVALGTLCLPSYSTGALMDSGRKARARDDAAAFVASDGHIRGPELEQALRDLHRQPLHAGTDDLALARAILASMP